MKKREKTMKNDEKEKNNEIRLNIWKNNSEIKGNAARKDAGCFAIRHF